MNHEEAMQHGLGYAAGREDASFVATHPSDTEPELSGFHAFAKAYADGWDEYNRGERGYMTTAQYAYDSWQRTGGRTIFDPVFGRNPPPVKEAASPENELPRRSYR